MNYLLYAIALPKRFNFTARVYRRARRAYAVIIKWCNPMMTWEQNVTLAITTFVLSGGIIGYVLASILFVIKLLIP